MLENVSWPSLCAFFIFIFHGPPKICHGPERKESHWTKNALQFVQMFKNCAKQAQLLFLRNLAIWIQQLPVPVQSLKRTSYKEEILFLKFATEQVLFDCWESTAITRSQYRIFLLGTKISHYSPTTDVLLAMNWRLLPGVRDQTQKSPSPVITNTLNRMVPMNTTFVRGGGLVCLINQNGSNLSGFYDPCDLFL